MHATPLFITLLFLEMTDIVFAVDSVPAIFALTREPLIVFTSNIFAILGLRNLYFMLRGAIDKFHMLKYGLGIVLVFVGCKMTVFNRLFEAGTSRSAGPWGSSWASSRCRSCSRCLPQAARRPGGHHVPAAQRQRRDEAEREGDGWSKTHVKEITPKSEDYSQWYLDVVLKAELADYGPVKGCMVIRPYGYARLGGHAGGHGPAHQGDRPRQRLLPLLIPKSFLEKEKEHVEGFSPECAWVTDRRRGGAGGAAGHPPHLGGHDLLHVRQVGAAPGATCPILINQWANVVRWEKVTRPFLRTTEFLWQEGHTLHATEEEAEEETLKMLHVYRSFSEEMLAMPVVRGPQVREREVRGGAAHVFRSRPSWGTARRCRPGTSHNLGQHFATAYGIEFLDKNQQRALPWSTSWGTSTRHDRRPDHDPRRRLGPDPAAARWRPYQVVIVPIPPRKGDSTRPCCPRRARSRPRCAAPAIRVHLDDRDTQQPGFKYADWEMRGVPLRLELGPKDIEKDQCVLVRRDTAREGVRAPGRPGRGSRELLDALQGDLLERARQFLADNTTRVSSYDEFKQVMAESAGSSSRAGAATRPARPRSRQRPRPPIRVIPTTTRRFQGLRALREALGAARSISPRRTEQRSVTPVLAALP